MKQSVFNDNECTCICGNKHELYGGKGYINLKCEAQSGGLKDNGYYIRVVECNVCHKVHTLKIID